VFPRLPTRASFVHHNCHGHGVPAQCHGSGEGKGSSIGRGALNGSWRDRRRMGLQSAGAIMPPEGSDHAAARRDRLIGVILLLGAAILWSLNGALIKLIHRDGAGPHGIIIAFYRSLVAGLFLLPLAWGRLHTLRGPAGVRAAYGLRPAALCCVIFFTLMTVCFVVANTKTEAGNAIILQYTSTFWVFGLSPLLLRERPDRRDLWILAIAILGIAVIFVGEAGTDLPGLLNALAAGLFYGLLTLMIRQMRDSNAAAVTVLNCLGSALLILPFTAWMGGLHVGGRDAVLLGVLGVVQFGIPYYLFSLGLRRVTAHHAALITLAEPIVVPIWAYLAVGELIPRTTLAGGAIVLAALGMFLGAARSRRSAAPRVGAAPLRGGC